jgi:hypothetical protein
MYIRASVFFDRVSPIGIHFLNRAIMLACSKKYARSFGLIRNLLLLTSFGTKFFKGMGRSEK